MNADQKTTNIKFVDRLLKGGTKPSGVYGILGPRRVGKSVLATMIAAKGSTGESIFTTPLYSQLPWIFIDLNNRRSLTVQRTLSHLGLIRRDAVDHVSDVIQTYEKERQLDLPTENGWIIPSSERRDLAFKAVYKQLFLIADDDEHPSFSSVSTQEWISGQVSQFACDQRGTGGIVIDGAQQVWRASKNATKLTECEFLEQLVSNFCRRLAEEYQCPLWITLPICEMHFDCPPATQLTHHDASDCKSFANGMDACLVMGTQSQVTPEHLFSIKCTKGDLGLDSGDRILLKHDRHFSTIVEAEGYVEDHANQDWKKVTA